MKPETLEKVLKLVSLASMEELEEISFHTKRRYNTLSKRTADLAITTLQPGDTVELTNLKPKYLNGTYCEVVERRGNKFKVHLSPGADPRALVRFGGNVICPASCLRKV